MGAVSLPRNSPESPDSVIPRPEIPRSPFRGRGVPGTDCGGQVQTENLPLTVAQAATLMNVSERSVRDARRLLRAGRPDLVVQVEAGRMSLHRALILAGAKSAPSQANALRNAWRRASDAERERFIAWLSFHLTDSRGEHAGLEAVPVL
jgi:hypothetical protein